MTVPEKPTPDPTNHPPPTSRAATLQPTPTDPITPPPTTNSFHSPETARPSTIPSETPVCPTKSDCPNSAATDLTKQSEKIIKDKPNWLLPCAASFNTLLVGLNLLLNFIIVTYYWSNSGNLSSTLYLRNGIADSISAIGFLVQVPLVFQVLEDIPPSLALISYWIATVSVRMSVFMNCLLGVVRSINILSPFYLVNRKWVTISTTLYFILWSTIASLDVWIYASKIGLKNKVYLVRSLVLKPEPGFSLSGVAESDNRALTSLSQGEVVALQFLTPLAVPAALCFVLMIFQIYHLT